MKILIVEDDKEINDLLAEFLTGKGYEVMSLYDGRKAAETAEQENTDLVLLDIMLPYKSGDSILEEIRKNSMRPVIVISAKDTTQNKIDLLRLGADDYITKPFDMEEVLARIESALRRASFQTGGSTALEYKGLKVDPENKTASLDGTELSLTAKEYAILELLLKYPQKVFSKANLFESVWGEEYITEDNALNVHISNLRNKLKAIRADQDYIDTVWGIGFRLHKEK
ncbi:MAG: response regulator transcription factor [Lachnospiraceae bacterium]|nr:response regulator transcription factor [Lachnospiraceae bacterium]MBR6155514.1 response regulator transcription factor [Lachnospiraceae bacterium]